MKDATVFDRPVESKEIIVDPSDPFEEGQYGMGLFLLAGILFVLVVRVNHSRKMQWATDGGSAPSTPEFKKFRATFMRAYLLALLTEWLQGAHLYMLLDFYTYSADHIARIFLAGVASQLSMAVLLELTGGVISLKSRCVSSLALQGAASTLLLHPAFGGLVLSRVLAGAATALMQTAFEGWMIDQSACQGFPQEWLMKTFEEVGVGMSVLAVCSGVLGESALAIAGVTGPFQLGLTIAFINALLVISTWRRDAGKGFAPCGDAGRLLARVASAFSSSTATARVAIMQACFEAATFIFALRWTPIIASRQDLISAPGLHHPYGLVFAQFMVCVMIGSYLYHLATQPVELGGRACRPQTLLTGSCAFAAMTFFLLTCDVPHSMVSGLCLMYETAVGMYLNAAGQVRSEHMSSDVRGPMLATARLVVVVPCLVLAVLACTASGGQGLLPMCGVLCVIAAMCSKSLPPAGAESDIEV